MQNLTRAHDQLFERAPDDRFSSLVDLWEHCHSERKYSEDRWHQPSAVVPEPVEGRLRLRLGDDGSFGLSDWSFGQVCRLARVSKDTINQVSADTAGRVLRETLPMGDKPLQLYTAGDRIRSIHPPSYTRLYNVDLLTMLREYAVDFQPPQEAADGGTGLYCGEQDMFVFMIDPGGWTEIEGQAFAPGFFIWNSEVGRRSVGVQTFWFQKVCQNHIVWDAVEVMEFTRKHTANVHECLNQIRKLVEQLVQRRDERRDGFMRVIKKAMHTHLGDDHEEVFKVLQKQGITKTLANEALEIAKRRGAFTIFALVDALTQIAGKASNASDRIENDQRAAKLLALAA